MRRVRRHLRGAGFSLIEAITVVAIIALLAGGVAPAIRSQMKLEQAASAGEAGRLLRVARANAMATGEPTGLRVSVTDQTLTLVVCPSPGDGVSALTDALGMAIEPVVVSERFPAAAIKSVVGGAGETGNATLWFAHSGEPQVRNNAGVLTGSFDQDAVIVFEGDHEVAVRAVSGVIE